MEKHSPLSLAQILSHLASVLGYKQTGTFYIATDNNTSCRFAINAGKLTHCTHRRDQGQAAVLSLLEVTGGSCSFSENQLIPFRASAAVDHQACLALLSIQPISPPRQEAMPQVSASIEQSVVPPQVANQFYRGSMPVIAPEPAPLDARKVEPPPEKPAVNNRFYRGGG